MVPKQIGNELRARRLRLCLTQTDVGRSMGTTRQYVSEVEIGVPWDPDADKLVVWAQTLGWEDDYILRRLGRTIMPVAEASALTEDLVERIRQAVAEGVQQGVAEALRDRLDGPGDTGPSPGGPLPQRPGELLA